MSEQLTSQCDPRIAQMQVEIERLTKQLVKERERCAAICYHWIETFQDREIQYTSARDYAVDAINDIADLIRDGIDPRESSTPSVQSKGWQPIETAPRDGTMILAALSWLPYAKPLFWATYANEWRCPAVERLKEPFLPTHWRPMPSSPKVVLTEDQQKD